MFRKGTDTTTIYDHNVSVNFSLESWIAAGELVGVVHLAQADIGVIAQVRSSKDNPQRHVCTNAPQHGRVVPTGDTLCAPDTCA